MFDLRRPFRIPSSLILALAGTILSSLVHFSSVSLPLQPHPAGMLSSFHSWKDLSEMWICVTLLLKMPSCLPQALTLEVRSLDYPTLVYFSRFRFVTSFLLLSQDPHTFFPHEAAHAVPSPWSSLSFSSALFVFRVPAPSGFSAAVTHSSVFLRQLQDREESSPKCVPHTPMVSLVTVSRPGWEAGCADHHCLTSPKYWKPYWTFVGWRGLVCVLLCMIVLLMGASSLNHAQLFVTPSTTARQAPVSVGILQARIREWVAMPSSRGSFQPRDRTQVSRIAGGFFTVWVNSFV